MNYEFGYGKDYKVFSYFEKITLSAFSRGMSKKAQPLMNKKGGDSGSRPAQGPKRPWESLERGYSLSHHPMIKW